MDKLIGHKRLNRLAQIKNYAVYYGPGRLGALEKYYMVIVEPKGHNEESINRLRSRGTIVIAYVSVVEIPQGGSPGNFLKNDDLLKVDGRTIENKKFDTVLADLRSKRWKNLLIHHIGDLLFNKGYNGVFLDTIGDIEYDCIPRVDQDLLLREAVHLIHQIRSLFKDAIIIQNNGLSKLIYFTKDVIDGVCWENPPVICKKGRKWAQSLAEKLKGMQQKGLKVLLLLEKDGQLNASAFERKDHINHCLQIAEKNNFLCHIAQNNYLDI